MEADDEAGERGVGEEMSLYDLPTGTLKSGEIDYSGVLDRCSCGAMACVVERGGGWCGRCSVCTCETGRVADSTAAMVAWNRQQRGYIHAGTSALKRYQ